MGKRITKTVLFFFILSLLVFYILKTASGNSLLADSDLIFHYNRFEYLYKNILEGNFINSFYEEGFLYDMGYPMGIFYPQGTLYFFVGFTILFGLTPYEGFVLTIILILFAGFTSMYAASRVFFRDTENEHLKSILSALIFVLLPTELIGTEIYASYFVMSLFSYGSIGQSIALVAVPWVFVGLRELFSSKPNGKYLVLSLMVIAYTHIMTALIIGVFVIIFLLAKIKGVIQEKAIRVELIKTFLFTLALCSYQIFPMIEMMIHQSYIYSEPILKRYGLYANAVPFGDFNQSLISPIFFLIQLISGFTLIWVYFIVKKPELKLLLLALIGFYVSSKLFPWQLLQNTLIKVIQWPYRILFLTPLFLSFSIPQMIPSSSKNIIKISSASIVFLALILLVFSNHGMRHKRMLPLEKVLSEETRTIFVGGGAEYLPQGFPVDGIDEITGITNAIMHDKLNKLREKAELNPTLIPKFYYKGYEITYQGKRLSYHKGYGGLIELDESVENKKELTITKETGFIQKLTLFITFLTLISYITYLYLITVRKNLYTIMRNLLKKGEFK